MESDDKLYQAFLLGDTDALDTLVLRYRERLIAYLRSLLRSEEDAEDMAMEAFARIMAKKPRIGEGSFRAYLYQTARHLTFRFLRKYRLEDTGLDEVEIPEFRTAEEIVTEAERSRILLQCLANMEPAVREAVWLFYFENLSYAQAAKVMHVNGKKIDNLLMKGRRLLRAELEKEGITDAG